nr:hypothetical protein [Tanacetum cinerariifolium]
MSHHSVYDVKLHPLYDVTFKFTKDDLSESALRRNIGDKTYPLNLGLARYLEDESKAFEQGMSTDTDDDKPVAPNPQHEKEELSPDEDLDEWLNAEMEKHIASVNVMLKSIFKHLKLASLKETSMVVEMADMTKRPLPFLETMHAHIDVYRKEISLGIGEEGVKFDMNRVRYGNKIIDDKTRERRYYEWVVQNSEFNDSGIVQRATIDDNPCRKKCLDDVWEKCERFQDTECPWNNERFSQQGIGIGGLLDPLSCGKKVLSGHNHIGYTVTDIITT